MLQILFDTCFGPFLVVLFLSLAFGLTIAKRETDRLRLALKRSEDRAMAENRQCHENLEAKWDAEEATIKARGRVAILERGIRKHMEAKGHDRCWVNDLELYQLMDPGYDKMNMALPCLPEFLHNCCLYWRDSQPPEFRKLGD